MKEAIALLACITIAFNEGFCMNLDEFRAKTTSSWGGLYPRESISRDVRNLDGIWDFRLAPIDDPDQGFREEWFKQPLKLSGSFEKIPVPSSYNDVTQNKEIRDHVGWAWYDRTFHVPQSWITNDQRIVLRIGSAHYNSITYVNGHEVVRHEGGHLPIMAEISKYVFEGQKNLLTICMNNTLTPDTLPQGEIIHEHDIKRYPAGYFAQHFNFDFFNYAGLHRPVYIYSTPKTYIEDIHIITSVTGNTGEIHYNITAVSDSGSLLGVGCSVKVYDQKDNHIKSAIGCIGDIDIKNATFWWPYLMSDDPAYMYTLQVAVVDTLGNTDVYPQKVGIRSLSWNSTTLTINNKPLYLTGFGRHEDANIRGRGFDYGLMVKDFSLLKWVGANSFRTSHYPYAEEIMDMADEEGIMIIDESPAIGLTGFGENLLDLHISVMEELIRRDKNRPSVIMWSVGNEPKSAEAAAEPYFRNISSATKGFDSTRPVTCVISVALNSDLAAQSFDVMLINRYFSWYSDTGHLEVVYRQTINEVASWHFKHNKPVMISEYGAGSISGIHIGPSFTWSEEYQVDLMMENFKAFDDLYRMGFFCGEMIWNFADFATPQETNRPPGCMKGIFTRNRQPKMAAHVAKWRYWGVAERLYNASNPSKKCSSSDSNFNSFNNHGLETSSNNIYNLKSTILKYIMPF